MPRPKNGYVNAAGQAIPGTHDPISRYMDQTALKIWAYNQGKAGLPLWGRSAIDIGSTVHGMAELDLKGRPDREIEAYCHQCLVAPDHLRKAFSAFAQFRAWRQQCHVRAIAQEVTLVSEAFQYGGTPDTIAMIDGGLGLLDFKTSPKPYPDHLIALAAHGKLWNENNPQHPLSSYHLICLPKDGSAFQHHAYADLEPQWWLFQLWLEAYRLEKRCTLAKAAKAAMAARPATVAVPPKAALTAAATATVVPFRPAAVPESPPRRARKPATAKAAPVVATPPIVVPPPLIAPPRASLSMAELLRSYGHIKEVAPC